MHLTTSEILSAFQIQGDVLKTEPFGNGHINDTFRVFMVDTNHPGYILQRKNHQVFKDVPGMMENILRVTHHIRKKLITENISDVERKVITHIQAKNNKFYFEDHAGNFWTVFKFIKNSKSVEKIENPEHAFLAGKGFGKFQQQLADLHGKPLNETIIDFHNIESRYRNFEKALAINYENRKSLAKKEIEFALNLKNEMHTLIWAQRENKIPVRITHNDTKINNILFDQNNNILCVIDLDTVMPGLVHFDFGDAIRTAACTAEEDETKLDIISINLDIFEGFTRGFLSETKLFLTREEINLLVHSAKFMTFIMGLRFLTDFIEGDVYYKINRPEHNFDRCKAQFKLVSEIGKNEVNMNKIIKNLL